MKETPIYKYPAAYAIEHGELELYRASNKANEACKAAIEAAISEHYYDNRLHKEAVPQVVEQFGYERTLYVLANTIRQKDWDGRFSDKNKQWAKNVPIFDNLDSSGAVRNCCFTVNSHPGLVDLFTSQARHDFLLTQPLTDNDIRYEAATLLRKLQEAQEPNSPNGTHFMARLSSDFMERASSKDTSRVLAYMPFQSVALSTLNDRKGIFLLISKDENRFQPLKDRKPSVRDKLKTQAEPAKPIEKKAKELLL